MKQRPYDLAVGFSLTGPSFSAALTAPGRFG
jgi:hypothetical protein